MENKELLEGMFKALADLRADVNVLQIATRALLARSDDAQSDLHTTLQNAQQGLRTPQKHSVDLQRLESFATALQVLLDGLPSRALQESAQALTTDLLKRSGRSDPTS